MIPKFKALVQTHQNKYFTDPLKHLQDIAENSLSASTERDFNRCFYCRHSVRPTLSLLKNIICFPPITFWVYYSMINWYSKNYLKKSTLVFKFKKVMFLSGLPFQIYLGVTTYQKCLEKSWRWSLFNASPGSKVLTIVRLNLAWGLYSFHSGRKIVVCFQPNTFECIIQ
jgi:hypothetical protein